MIPRRYLSVINVFLILLLLAGGAYLAWLLLAPPLVQDEVGVSYETRERKPERIVAPGLAYYEIISQRNLWRTKFQPPEERPPATPPPPPAPPPKLELKGTSVHEDPEKSWAIIEDLASKTQKIYRMNDIIRGWMIVEIERGKVTIDNRGRRVVLTAFKGSIPVPPTFLSNSRIYRKLGPNRWLVSRVGLWKKVNAKMLEKMKKKGFRLVPEDIIGALSTVGCRPYYPPDKRQRGPAQGYEIVILPRDHLAYRLGIREGDIIRTIAGKKVTGKQQAMDILLEVQGYDRVLVEVGRGDKTVTLEYLIQERELDPSGS